MTHTIDAGIGVFTVSCEENLKLKMFLDSLKDQIELGRLDDLIHFVDNDCESNLKQLMEDMADLENDLKNKEEEIKNLKNEVSELEDKDEVEDEIEAGLGKIGFVTDNLLTQQVMEQLGEALNKTNPVYVLEYLQKIA